MKLNIASATNMFPFPGWLNIDRVDQSDYLRILREEYAGPNIATLPDSQRRLAEFLQAGGTCEFKQHDLRDGFDWVLDGSVECIYLGQIVEHLQATSALPRLLRECHRMLQPGVVVRITTPDLERILNAFMNRRMMQFAPEQPDVYACVDSATQLSFLMFGALGEENRWDAYDGHMHCWTVPALARVLREAGFSRVEEKLGRQSWSAAMATECEDRGMTHSLAIEGMK
jgi:hypothetical protein